MTFAILYRESHALYCSSAGGAAASKPFINGLVGDPVLITTLINGDKWYQQNVRQVSSTGNTKAGVIKGLIIDPADPEGKKIIPQGFYIKQDDQGKLILIQMSLPAEAVAANKI